MTRVNTRVFVRGEEGREAILNPGDTVPDWAEVTNPDVILDEAAETEEAPEAPEDTAPAEQPTPAKRAPRRKATAPASE